ncbi:hypothetical protein ACYSNR_06925 [Enterococcus sp. LJL128]
MENNQAIKFVDNSLSIGDYGYVLRRYIYHNEWDKHVLKNIANLIFKPMTNFNYSRCFSYMFMEDIDLKQPFFAKGTREAVAERGYIEFISLKISAISPVFYIEKAQYEPHEDGIKHSLNIRELSQFKNTYLEEKYEELIHVLEKEEL